MNIVDELVVTFGLDPKQFTAEQKKALDAFKKTRDEADKRAKEIAASGKVAAEFFSKLRDQVIELFAIFTAGKGIKDFIQDVTTTTAMLGRMAYQLDETVGDLSSWRGAAVAAGGTADGVTQSISNLTMDLQNLALTGQSNTIPYFRALGISLTEANGKFKTAGELFLEINKRIQGMDPARARAIMQGLGFDQGTMNLLFLAPDKLKELLAYYKKLAPSKSDIEAMQNLQLAWFKFLATSEAVGRTMLVSVGPALLQALGYVQGFFDYLRNNRDVAQDVFYGIATAVGVLSTAITVNLVAGALSNLKNALLALNALLLKSPIGRIILALVAGYEAASWISDKLDKYQIGGVKLGLKFKDLFGGSSSTGTGGGTTAGGLPLARPSGGSGLGGGGSALDVMRFFVKRGWTPAQAAAITANLKYESGLNVNKPGDSGEAYGIAQWHSSRQRDFASLFGKSIKGSTLLEQLDFVDKELTGKEGKAGASLRSAADLASAVRAMMFNFERPKSATSYGDRLAIAQNLMRGASAATASSNSTSTQTSSVNIDHLTIHSRSSDGKGLAADFSAELRRQGLAAQGNFGPS